VRACVSTDRTVANKVDDVADPAEDGKSTAVQKATMNTLNIPDSKRTVIPASEFKNGGYVADDDKYLDKGKTTVHYDKTSISCRWRTRATRCITSNVLQTKVDAQCDKLATELS